MKFFSQLGIFFVCRFLICLLISPSIAYGQFSISGTVSDYDDVIPLTRVGLIESDEADTIFETTDFNGYFKFDSIPNGFWNLHIDAIDHEEYSIKLNNSDSDTTLEIKLDLCSMDYPRLDCPQCHNADDVIRVSYHVRVNRTFKDDRSLNKYKKKIHKQGYDSFIRSTRQNEVGQSKDNEEILIQVFDEDSHKLLKNTDACDRYLFCKKHKSVFK